MNFRQIIERTGMAECRRDSYLNMPYLRFVPFIVSLYINIKKQILMSKSLRFKEHESFFTLKYLLIN